jgi:guanylate kinase
MHPNPQLIVLSSPSGGGKTTICKALASRNPELKISVSATTRSPREGETEGVEYHFLSSSEFFRRVENDEFLEYEEVHGNYYGTLKSKVVHLLQDGSSVIFDIDVNGALAIKKKYSEAILIFIRPPSLEELKRRLRARKTEDPTSIEKRLQRLPMEYAKAKYFDYDIVNEDLEKTIRQIQNIVKLHQGKKTYVSHS